jgi:hypothetical protein
VETQKPIYCVRAVKSSLRTFLTVVAIKTLLSHSIFFYVVVLVFLQEHTTGLIENFVGFLASGRCISVALELLNSCVSFQCFLDSGICLSARNSLQIERFAKKSVQLAFRLCVSFF